MTALDQAGEQQGHTQLLPIAGQECESRLGKAGQCLEL